MQFDSANLIPLLPEILVGTLACVILVLDLFLTDQRCRITYGLALATLVAALGLTLFLGRPQEQIVMDGTYVRDAMGDGLKAFIFLVSLIAFIYSRDYLQRRGLFRGEFYVLGLFAVLGMAIMVSAQGFLSVYLGTRASGPVPLCPGGLRPGLPPGRRGRYEVLRARGDRLRNAAVRHLHGVRGHGIHRLRGRRPGRRPEGADRQGPGAGAGVRAHRRGLQVRCRALPYVVAGRL